MTSSPPHLPVIHPYIRYTPSPENCRRCEAPPAAIPLGSRPRRAACRPGPWRLCAAPWRRHPLPRTLHATDRSPHRGDRDAGQRTHLACHVFRPAATRRQGTAPGVLADRAAAGTLHGRTRYQWRQRDRPGDVRRTGERLSGCVPSHAVPFLTPLSFAMLEDLIRLAGGDLAVFLWGNQRTPVAPHHHADRRTHLTSPARST